MISNHEQPSMPDKPNQRGRQTTTRESDDRTPGRNLLDTSASFRDVQPLRVSVYGNSVTKGGRIALGMVSRQAIAKSSAPAKLYCAWVHFGLVSRNCRCGM